MSSKITKRGLGAGLGAIFGDDEPEIVSNTLPLSRIEPRPDQPRSRFDDDAIYELSESISQHGLLQPITVRPLEGGQYQIIAGERRWRASRLAGLSEVPVHIIQADDRYAMELALVENLQREDLNPMEEARGYRKLQEEYGMTQEQISKTVGKSRPAVANALRLLSLDGETEALVEDGKLSAGHARALLRIESPAKRAQTAEEIVRKGWSVRKAELAAEKIAKGLDVPKTPNLSPDGIDYTREAEKELESALGRKIKISEGKRSGRIEIEFYGADDREKLLRQLKLLGGMRK